MMLIPAYQKVGRNKKRSLKVCGFFIAVLSTFYAATRALNKRQIERSSAAHTLLQKELALTHMPSTNDVKREIVTVVITRQDNAGNAVGMNEKSPFKNKPAFLNHKMK